MSKEEIKKETYTFYKPKEGLTKKTCNICNKELPIGNFWKDKYLKDGYTNYCKVCYKKRWIDKDPAYQGKRKYQDMNRK